MLIDLKVRERANNIVIVGDFNNPRSTVDRSLTQKTNKETLDLSQILDQMDLTDIECSIQ